MRMQFGIKHLQMIMIVGVLFFPFYGRALGAEQQNPGWQKMETAYTIIYYADKKGLEKFNAKIDYGPSDWGRNRRQVKNFSEELFERITPKVDAIYERVQELLDMRKAMEKVVVRIYPDTRELSKAYEEIYGKTCQIRAWYIFEYHTIYLNVDDLHEGMLAHELAHAVIDHFLLVRPPPATAEILARYVDSHLK